MAISDYKTALVTGATSGIGAEVVKQLCARGLTVHATGRRADRLEALAGETGCRTHALDVRDTAALYDTLGGLSVDILVNNAGIGRGFETMFAVPPEKINDTLMTNVVAAVHVVRAVLPGMVERKCGHLVNIGSVAGLYPIKPSVYGASKGAVHLLTQNLRVELQGCGVRVTEICPGRVATEFFNIAFEDQPELAAQAYSTGCALLEAVDVADAVVYALDTPWHVNISCIELSPTEQFFGGTGFAPAR
jgi:3-hydroxy acid dehydrogenase/malonic semialdehyde reductase